MCECLDHYDERNGRSAHVCEACFPASCPDDKSLGDWCIDAEADLARLREEVGAAARRLATVEEVIQQETTT